MSTFRKSTDVTTEPQIFLTDYKSYNEGNQFVYGHWVDLTQFSTIEEFDEYLEEHFKAVGIDQPEVMFTDYEGFPSNLYSESYDVNKMKRVLVYVNDVRPELEGFDGDDWVSKHNEYCRENQFEDEIMVFDEDFFETYFSTKYEAARATAFGSVNWSDSYIKFDGYANLKSLSEYDVENEVDKESIINWMIDQAS